MAAGQRTAGQTARGAAMALWVACLGLPGAAAAQQNLLQIQPSFDPGSTAYQVQIVHPNVNDDGVRLTCSYGTPNCLTFNRDMCTNPLQAVPVELAIGRGNAPVGQGANGAPFAYAWLQRSNSVCSTDPSLTQQGNLLWPSEPAQTKSRLTSSYGVASASGSAAVLLPKMFGTNWPEDQMTSDKFPSLTVGSILHAFPDVCADDGGVSYARWRLCMGVDFANTGIINPAAQAGSGTSSAQTPVGWMEFLVSTTQPPAPTVATPMPLFGRVHFSVTYENGQQNLKEVRVDSRKEDPASARQFNCDAVAAGVKGEPQDIGGKVGTGTIEVDVHGDNGSPYAYCVYTIDVVGNLSLPAGPFYASPSPETGVFGVWDDLDPGFGGCQSTSAYLPLWPLGWALIRRQRRPIGRTPRPRGR